MKITKQQLRRIVRETTAHTKKYDDDSALKGDQSELPDSLQKGIIDKTVEDRETREEEEREKKNESLKITKRQLRRIIKELGDPALRDQWTDKEPESGTTDEWYDFLMSVIDTEIYDRGSDFSTEASSIVEALEMTRRSITDKVRGPTR